VYVTRTQVLLEKNSIFGDRCLPYLMKPEESVDIDTLFDLFIAECLLTRRLAQEAG
jgi:CMP-N-acetylneuraminic acid synthetase